MISEEKLTIDPDPGMAVKEILFTQKENTLYAICPIYPKEELTIRKLKLKPEAKISLLGSQLKLTWRQENEDIVVDIPSIIPGKESSQLAYVFKLEGILE